MDTQKNQSANNIAAIEKKKSLWEKLFQFFFGWISQSKKAKPTANSEMDNSPNSPEVEKLSGNLQKEVESFADSISIPEIERKYIFSIKYMIDSGYFDGISGIRKEGNNDIKEIAENRAEELYNFSTESLESRKAKLEEQLNCFRKIKERHEQEDKLQHEYYNFLVFNYRFFPRNFSYLLFALYIVSFLILLIADIPLAVELIRNGFDLPPGSAPLKDLLKNGKFWITIKENWEVFFTAVGITMSTVYIKIVYDEFVGSQYGHRVVSQKKFMEVFSHPDNAWQNVLTDEEKGKIRSDKKKTDYWKFGILILTLSTLIVLGFFRRDAWDLMKGLSQVNSTVLFFTFLSLTLMFPIIGGVCLSLALTNWQNRRRLNEAKKDCKQSYKKSNNSLIEVTKLEGEYADLNKKLDKWKDADSKTKKLTALLLSYYQQGYNIGITKPDSQTSGKNFYEKVILWQSKAVARKINSNIVKTAHT